MTIAYFALSLNTSNLYGDVYLNCFLSAVVELPAYVLSWLLFRWLPRRMICFWTLFLGGVFIFLTQLVPEGTKSIQHQPSWRTCEHPPPPDRSDLRRYNTGDDGEVCRGVSLRHLVRLFDGTLPDGGEEHGGGRLLHGGQDRQHHGAILHLLTYACSVLSDVISSPSFLLS